MACISMNDSLGDSAKQLMNHDCFVVLRDRIKSLLHNMAPKRVHGKTESVATYGFGNFDDLLWGAMLKTTLN
ncbi:hypothetical protein CRV24_006912 [Beauveria bassiana]|nr:hypothetical protein CRV24_006912 [Beauveria bassiana]